MKFSDLRFHRLIDQLPGALNSEIVHSVGTPAVTARPDNCRQLGECSELASNDRLSALLAAGLMYEAAKLLGHRFTIRHNVIKGRQLGRQLGFPTANMKLSADIPLRNGVYAVRFRRADGGLFSGVASLGHRPTIEANGVQLLETYIFDFCDDLYGEPCSVSFFDYIRKEQKFDDLESLVSAMKRDEAQARTILRAARPVGAIDTATCF